MINPRTDKLIKRITIVATAAASYFLLTADYGPEPNALDPKLASRMSSWDPVISLEKANWETWGSSSTTKKQN